MESPVALEDSLDQPFVVFGATDIDASGEGIPASIRDGSGNGGCAVRVARLTSSDGRQASRVRSTVTVDSAAGPPE
jgi:hypothetical protein